MKTLIVLTLAGTALLTQQASDATRIFRAAREVETDIPAEAYEKGIPVEIGLVDDRLRVVVGRLAPRVIRLDSPYLTGRIGLRHSPGSVAVAPVRYEGTKLSVD